MFAESDTRKTKSASWLERNAARHPRLFDALLVVVYIAIVLFQLRQTEYSFVLYQGF